MALTIPLLIMLALLASAWWLGTIARSKDIGFMKLWGTIGVIGVLLLPVAYEATIFDGNCLGIDGTKTPCSMSESLWNSFQLGFAFTVPPAIMWLVAFVMSSKMGDGGKP